MADTQLESQVINHLEFLGYEVNRDPDADTTKMKMLRAEHSGRGGINIRLWEGMLTFSAWFSLNDFAMADRQALFEVVQGLNWRFSGKYYIGKVGETHAFMRDWWYYGPYDKKVFGQFVSVWEWEGQAMWETEIDKFVG